MRAIKGLIHLRAKSTEKGSDNRNWSCSRGRGELVSRTGDIKVKEKRLKKKSAGCQLPGPQRGGQEKN